MKHKTWFRLALKLIGVLLIGLSIPDAWSVIYYTIRTSVEQGGFGNMTPGFSPLFDMWIPVIGVLLQLVFGLYLFFAGQRIVDIVIPSNRPYCPNCGYDLSKSGGEHCTECGVRLPDDVRTESESSTSEPQ